MVFRIIKPVSRLFNTLSIIKRSAVESFLDAFEAAYTPHNTEQLEALFSHYPIIKIDLATAFEQKSFKISLPHFINMLKMRFKTLESFNLSIIVNDIFIDEAQTKSRVVLLLCETGMIEGKLVTLKKETTMQLEIIDSQLLITKLHTVQSR